MSASLGSYLRGLRQQRGVSIDEISRATRIPPRYLEALEQDDLGVLPAPVFIRGFVRAYCQALGEPPEQALALYEPPQVAPAPSAPSRHHGSRSNGAPVIVSLVLLVVFGAALGGVTLLLQSDTPEEVQALDPADGAVVAEADPGPTATATPAGDTVTAKPREAPTVVAAAPETPKSAAPAGSGASPVASPPAATASAVASAQSAPASATPSATPSPAPAPTPSASPPTAPAQTATPPPIVVGAVTSPYRLVARATEATWIRVRTADGRTIEETIPAGQTREWVSDRPFVLTVGNAGGVAFELNGEKLPVLGAPGAVIQRLVLPPTQQ